MGKVRRKPRRKSETPEQRAERLAHNIGVRKRSKAVKELKLGAEHAVVPGLRYLPGIDEAQIHDPANGAPAPPTSLASPTYNAPGPIVTRPPTFAFRYLGYMLRVDLDPQPVMDVLAGRVWKAVSDIRRWRLDLVQASDYMREYLYPRLELGLIFARLTKVDCDSWDALLRSAVLHRYADCNVRALAAPALRLALGVLPLHSHARMVKSIELGGALRGGLELHARTAWCRLHRAVADRKLVVEPTRISGASWTSVVSAVDSRHNRLTGIVKSLTNSRIGITYQDQSPCPVYTPDGVCSADERLGCSVLRGQLSSLSSWSLCPPADNKPKRVAAFTDGAFTPGKSGFAAVLCDEEATADVDFSFGPATCTVLTGGSPFSGASYAAEWGALVTALRAVPVNCDLVIYTDSLSAKQVLERPLIAVSRRLRLGARSLAVTAREIVRVRAAHGARTRVHHVRSHTLGRDLASRGNAYADVSAGEAAADSAFDDERYTPFLHNEERVVFWQLPQLSDDGGGGSEPLHISGNLRDVLSRQCEAADVRLWANAGESNAQGFTARMHGPQLAGLLRRVRRTKDAPLLLFLLLASTRQLATADKLYWPVSSRTPALMACRHCGKTQTAEHVQQCSAVHHLVLERRKEVARRLELITVTPLAFAKLDSAVRGLLLAAPQSFCWYDLNRPLSLRGFAGIDLAAPAQRLACATLNSHDRWAGSLGVLPRGLQSLLCPEPSSYGASEHLHKAIRREASDQLGLLQLAILRHTKCIYEAWRGRPVSDKSPPPPAPPLAAGLPALVLRLLPKVNGRRPVSMGAMRRRLPQAPSPRGGSTSALPRLPC